MLKKFFVIAVLALAVTATQAEEVKKVMIVGNSIMKHGKAPGIGWNYDWGMAATAEEKDYAHILYAKLCELVKPAKAPELELVRISNEKEMKGWDNLKGNDADIIVIQIGDNYRGKVNKEEFQDNYSQMIKDLRGDRNPIIACLSNWGNAAIATLIHNAAKENNVIFVNINELAKQPENMAKSEGNFTHGGVNWHPGDRGMAAIADATFTVLESPVKAKLAK